MSRNNVHEEIIELLPWLVNESLSAKEQLRVTSHLKGCEICRKERDNLQRLQAVVAEDDSVQSDYHIAFRKLETRISIAEANRSSVIDIPSAQGSASKQVSNIRMRRWFSGLGIAASLIVGFLLGSGAENMGADAENLSAQNLSQTTPGIFTAGNVMQDAATHVHVSPSNLVSNNERFVTLASGNIDDSNGVLHRVYLSFNPSVQAEAKRAALIETRSQIVSGPDKLGTYTVNMSIPVEQTDAEFINSIRQINGVQYADYKNVSGLQSDR